MLCVNLVDSGCIPRRNNATGRERNVETLTKQRAHVTRDRVQDCASLVLERNLSTGFLRRGPCQGSSPQTRLSVGTPRPQPASRVKVTHAAVKDPENCTGFDYPLPQDPSSGRSFRLLSHKNMEECRSKIDHDCELSGGTQFPDHRRHVHEQCNK